MTLSEPAAWAAYALFAGLALVGPGLALPRLFRASVDPALVLPLGTAACAFLFWLSLVVHPLLFPAAVGLLDLTLLARRGPWRRASGPSVRGAIPPFLALVAVLAATQYSWNRRGPDGDFLLDPMVPYDTAFHVGLTRELMLGYPPQVPGSTSRARPPCAGPAPTPSTRSPASMSRWGPWPSFSCCARSPTAWAAPRRPSPSSPGRCS